MCMEHEVLVAGMYSCKHDGQLCQAYDDARAAKAGAALGFVATLLQVRGDGTVLQKHYLHVQVWHPTNGVGYMRRKKNMHPTDFRNCMHDAEWRHSISTRYMYVNQQRLAGIEP